MAQCGWPLVFTQHRAQPFAVQRFQDFLEGLPDNVYRGKGLLWLAESDKRYIFHLVAKRFSLDEDGRQGQAGNKSKNNRRRNSVGYALSLGFLCYRPALLIS
jgi:G3E family GTPase